jgi:hypothetical protein
VELSSSAVASSRVARSLRRSSERASEVRRVECDESIGCSVDAAADRVEGVQLRSEVGAEDRK